MSSTCEPNQPVLGQKYRLIRQLDAGGMGSVWLAEALHLSSLVAVKTMDTALAATPEAAQRFLREARTAASLRSPHVVQILDYGVHDGTPFIAMELLEGESLATRLEREGRLASWEQTELVLRHVARALGRAHDAGVIHRDLKPANIFLVRDEEEEIVKLLDFGIAKATAASSSAALASNTRTGEFLGSPAYASPEQLQASKTLDHRADIWSFGVIAYECLLGRAPFASDSFVGLLLAICAGPLPVPSEQGPVPAGFDAWFARVCAREVEERFQSVREASAELKRVFGTARGSGATLSGPVASWLPAVERAPKALPAGLHAAQAPPARTDGPPEAPPPTPTAWPTKKLSLIPTQMLRLVAPDVPRSPRRRATALLAVLALPAIAALVFFTRDAATSRAAIDWKQLALGAGPPRDPAPDDPPRGGESQQLVPQPPEERPASRVEPGPAVTPVADAGAPADNGGVHLLGSAPASGISIASEPETSPLAPELSAPPRAVRARRATPSSRARLTITASAPSEVLLDGVPLGVAPLEGISVAPGRHEITFVHDGKRSTETLIVRNGEHKHVEARIGEEPGDGLEEAAVKRTIKRNRSSVIDTCWEYAFDPGAPGDAASVRVPVTISVEPSGSVRSVVTEAEGYPELSHCIETRVSAWRFPSARADTIVSVAFVFVME
jgi:eukaryotic-like serine/threonine-protein kinase